MLYTFRLSLLVGCDDGHPVVQGRTPLLGEEFRLQRIIRHPGNRECYRSLNKIELRAQNVCRPSSLVKEDISIKRTRRFTSYQVNLAHNGKSATGFRKSPSAACDRVRLRDHDESWCAGFGCLPTAFTK
jgi:hypothetical protein